MIFDRRGRCLHINGRGLAMMGLHEPDCREKNFEDFWPEEIRDAVRKRVSEVLGGIKCSFESPFMRPDGSEILWNIDLKPTYSRKGNIKGFVSINTDITKFRKAEEELEKYREHLQRLVDLRTKELEAAILKAEEEKARSEAIVAAIGDGFSIHGRDFKILYQNSVARELLGDHVGEYCFVAYRGTDGVCDNCHMARVFEDGHVHKKEGRITTSNGIGYTAITASPLRDAAGRIVAGIEVVRDVTERKISEEALRQTNERLRTVLDASPAAIVAFDRDGIVTLWNRSATRIFGWTGTEAVGSFCPVVNGNKVGEFTSMIEQALNGRSFFGAQFICRKKDGSPVDIMVSAGPLHDTQGNITSILAVATDITENKKTEQALKIAHGELNQIFNTAADGMAVIDRDFNILRINDTFLSMLDMKREDMTGRKCHDVFSTDSLCHTDYCPMTRILRGEESVEFEAEKIRCDGTRFLAVVTAAPFRNPEGGVIGIVEDIRDVSEQRKMEEAVRKAKNLESVGLLAGGLAHDFNNLLQGLLGSISIAVNCLEPDNEARRYLDQAQNISGMAKALTGQLLTFSRGYAPLRKPLLLGAKLREWVNFALSGTNIKGEFHLADRCLVDVDEGQIRQVIQNLTLNARDAMPDGGILKVRTRRVSITEERAIRKGNYMEISVEDRGPGIPKSNLSRIFEPYFSTKDTANQKGMGLGLAICHSIISKHGGSITAESTEKVGTIFTVLLPVSGKKITREKTPDFEVTGTSGFRGRVLIMDDEEIVTNIARGYLEKLGYESETARDGLSAIETYRDAEKKGKPFDMVILDLTVPGGSGGKETMAELLRINPGVRAIVSSGHSQEPIMSGYRQYGFLGALPKPYTLSELAAALSQIEERP